MRTKTSSALTGLLCLLLSACSSTGSDTTSMNRNGENYSSTAGSGTSGTSGSDDRSATANNAASMDGKQSDITIASATVQSIEPMARGMDQSDGEAQAGSSGTAGATAGSTGNMMYRVTLRLDDGSTRAVMQNSQPAYQVGDKVKMVNGLVQSY